MLRKLFTLLLLLCLLLPSALADDGEQLALLEDYAARLTGSWTAEGSAASVLAKEYTITKEDLFVSADGRVYLGLGSTAKEVLLTLNPDRILLLYTSEGTVYQSVYVRVTAAEATPVPAPMQTPVPTAATVIVRYLDMDENILDEQTLTLSPGVHTIAPNSEKVEGLRFLGPQSANVTVNDDLTVSMAVVQFFYLD